MADDWRNGRFWQVIVQQGGNDVCRNEWKTFVWLSMIPPRFLNAVNHSEGFFP